AMAIFRAAKDATLLAARYETLGVVMDVVGRNAGKTSAEMQQYEKDLRKTGIAAIEARDNLARMAGAQIDLANASQLARIAQDAAVIAGTNSSEAFSRLIDGISTGQTRILRTLGLFIDFDSALERYARSIGVAKDNLTEFQATQARANAVLEGGGQIAGAYEAAMGTAGKQLGSMKRLVDDLRVSVGGLWMAAFSKGVVGVSDALKDANAWVERNKMSLVAWADVGVKAVGALIAPFRLLIRLAFNFGQQVGEGATILGQLIAGDFAGMRATSARILANSDDVMNAFSDYLTAQVALTDAYKMAAKGGDSTAKANKIVTGTVRDQTAAVVALTAAQSKLLMVGAGVTGPNMGSFGSGTPESLARWKMGQANKSKMLPFGNTLTPSARGASTPGWQTAGAKTGIGGMLSDAGGAIKEGLGSLFAQFGPQGLALAAVFDIVKGAMEPLTPVIDALREPLRIVGTLIGQTLAPVLRLLVPVIELVAKAFTYVQQTLGYFVQGIGWLIDHLVPDFISKVGQNIEQYGKDMVANSKAARKALDATNDFAEALSAAAVNIPRALPLAYLRQQYGMGGPSGGTSGGTTGGSGGGGGGGGAKRKDDETRVTNYSFAAGSIVTQAQNGAELLDELEAELRRRKGSGQTVGMDRYYQLRTT
ncbi:MAG: hypothetical protein NUW22_13340, partial [Acidobacteria bacterium]|nr:hypothetical protein [Acidobacteriota bacterium]